MTHEPLRPILTEYRTQVETAWSADTAHPDYPGAAGSPVGQCGVTSAWLQQRLLEDHSIDATYCTGPVFGPAGGCLDAHHCWLEVGTGSDPAPLEDEDPQSTADATAARTAWIRANRFDDEEVARMKKDWNW